MKNMSQDKNELEELKNKFNSDNENNFRIKWISLSLNHYTYSYKLNIELLIIWIVFEIICHQRNLS